MKPDNVSALVSELVELVRQSELLRRQDSRDKRVAHLHVTDVARQRLDEARRRPPGTPRG